MALNKQVPRKHFSWMVCPQEDSRLECGIPGRARNPQPQREPWASCGGSREISHGRRVGRDFARCYWCFKTSPSSCFLRELYCQKIRSQDWKKALAVFVVKQLLDLPRARDKQWQPPRKRCPPSSTSRVTKEKCTGKSLAEGRSRDPGQGSSSWDQDQSPHSRNGLPQTPATVFPNCYHESLWGVPQWE